jgi:hypothetical protein
MKVLLSILLVLLLISFLSVAVLGNVPRQPVTSGTVVPAILINQ